MKLSSEDMPIVEQALRQAMNQETDYQAIFAYQEVLDKIRSADLTGYNERKQTTNSFEDGLRYDYDDTSDLMK